MQVSFSLYFMANHLPPTPQADEALKKSFVICDLPGKFVDDPMGYKNAHLDASWKEYAQPVDRELKAKFAVPEIRSAVMLYMCEEYRTHVLSGRSAFAAVPTDFAKWKDAIIVEKGLIAEVFYDVFEADSDCSTSTASPPR
jgi:hypothetical protein